MTSFKNSLVFWLLYLVPKNLLSAMVGLLIGIKLPHSIAIRVNKAFARVYGINLGEAEKPIEEYACLQDFFVRKLKPGLRPVPQNENLVISPCDGTLSIVGKITDGLLIQAKGRFYKVASLLASEDLAGRFMNGHFATLYLSPKDYHRFHVPMDGEIVDTIHIPGTLWPVNNWAVHNIKDLFCQNERVISLITHHKTKRMLAHIAVGAALVGKIDLCYSDISGNNKMQNRREQQCAIMVNKGQELGKFMFGSTIILLFEPGLIDGFVKNAPTNVKMGEILSNVA